MIDEKRRDIESGRNNWYNKLCNGKKKEMRRNRKESKYLFVLLSFLSK